MRRSVDTGEDDDRTTRSEEDVLLEQRMIRTVGLADQHRQVEAARLGCNEFAARPLSPHSLHDERYTNPDTEELELLRDLIAAFAARPLGCRCRTSRMLRRIII